MTKLKPTTHHYALLTATVAGLMSGQALAESAGHVSFVYGPVTATTHDGQTRTLHRGDEVNGGERITTNAGRIQIRFTDGGFVALQPNTVFGIDQYVYANKKPEDSSLFFNLVRGGMRTITGVIGHINKASYRVKTPVATIGIRGTEYVAELDGETLHVSVGLGAVSISNDQGNITLISGQSAFVTPNTAPTETTDTPNVGAPSPGAGGGSNGSDNGVGSGQTNNTPSTPSSGNQQQLDGGPQGLQQTTQTVPPLSSTSFGAPLYSMAMPGSAPCTGTQCTGTIGRPVDVNAVAGFDSSGDLLLVNGTSVFDNTGTTGALQYANVTNENGISFGELTNGQSQDGSVKAALGQFIPYVVGPSTQAPAPIGLVTYNLKSPTDATSPRLFSNGVTTSGTLNSFKIDIDLTKSLLDVNLDLTMKGDSSDYVVSASNLSVPNIVQNGSFQLTGLAGTGPACGNSCTATVGGFFAGNDGSRLGAGYDISTGSGDILGVAALTQVPGIATSSTPPLASSTSGANSPTYTFAVPIGGASNNSVLSGSLGATFDGVADSVPGAIRALKDGAGKVIFANPATVTSNGSTTSNPSSLSYSGLVTLGNISYTEVTSHDATTDGTGTLSVGSISNGSGGSTNTLTVTPGLYVPYIVGLTGAAPSLGIVHYSLQGGTLPRADLSLAGVLNHFNLDVDLSSLELSLDLGLTLNGANYDVVAKNQAVPNLAQSGSFTLNGLATTGSNCSTQTCTANVNGFFAGSSSSSSQLGATYAINVGTLDSINGVAALGQTNVAGAVAYQSNSYGQDARIGIDTYSDNNGLMDASTGNTPILNRHDDQGTQVTDVGSDGTLEWGRWVAGNPAVNGTFTASALTSTDALHYVSGAPTPSVVMSALNAQGSMVTYALEGGTKPTDGANVGSLNGGSLKVQFGGNPTMAVDLQVGINSKNYVVSGSGALSANSALFSLSSLGTTGCAASPCSTSVSGFFAGAQANKVGLGYAITDSSTVTRGAAAFSR